MIDLTALTVIAWLGWVGLQQLMMMNVLDDVPACCETRSSLSTHAYLFLV